MPTPPHTDDPVLFFIAERVNALGENLSDMNATVVGIRTDHENFRTEMLGNGQPGRVQRNEASIDELRCDVEKLNKKVWYASGGLAVVAVLAKEWLLKHFGGVSH